MATRRSPSARSVRSVTSEGGITVLSPEGSMRCSGGDHPSSNHGNPQFYHGNPITEQNIIIGVPRKKGCNSPLLPATASDSRVISSRIQDPPAAVVEGDSQKGGGDDDDVRNELELRNGLDEPSSNDDEEEEEEEDEEEDEEEEEEEDEEKQRVPHTAQEVLHAAGVDLDLDSVPSGEGAPLELVSQFLTCVMDEEYEAAKLLCEKVLEYEPGNATAQAFLPVILERMKLDDELSTASSSRSEDEIDSEEEEELKEEDERTINTHTHRNCNHSTHPC